MKFHPTLLALCAAAALCSPAFAGASVVYAYSGVVDSDDADRGWLAFTGQFTLDATAADQIGDASTADYKMSGAPYGMNVVFDGTSAFSFTDFFDVLVSNNLGGVDQFGVFAHNGNGSDSVGFTLYDFSQALFASDALPLPSGGITLDNFGWSEFKYESSGGMLNGHLTSLDCVAGCDLVTTPVPEPGTLTLVLAGLGAIGASARRRGLATQAEQAA